MQFTQPINLVFKLPEWNNKYIDKKEKLLHYRVTVSFNIKKALCSCEDSLDVSNLWMHLSWNTTEKHPFTDFKGIIIYSMLNKSELYLTLNILNVSLEKKASANFHCKKTLNT